MTDFKTPEELHIEEDRNSQHNDDEKLLTHPRTSTVISAAILGMLLLCAAAITFCCGVRTNRGQQYDNWVWAQMRETVQDNNIVYTLASQSYVVIGFSTVLMVAAVVVALIRKRRFLAAQIVVFLAVAFGSAWLLKRMLVRPVIDSSLEDPANSAPSGHTALITFATIAFVLAASRVLRGISALLGAVLTTTVGVVVIADRWHRPTDVIMAIFLVGGFAMIALAFTRKSGMDEPGTRASSPTLQVICAAMITGGLLCWAYAGYILWQLWDYIEYHSTWATSSANAATIAMVGGSALLVFGLIGAYRQLTAAPLSAIGLIGAPPQPPRE